MHVIRSDEWSNAHLAVNDCLSRLLNTLRDLGYNPSLHISYDQDEQHIVVDPELRRRHPEVEAAYQEYVSYCRLRDAALRQIQELPKVDLGFQ
ncbi:hypothetical protein GCM10010885_05350 [Alicyclobacillus cellulosilyticus]|uniref:Uncharacterized protein n=1 Tax=Alicyclobacillus cellulosilyticus TaxID=1003997 RepID=A0A917NHM9_9BACL|nr:hypothetical protein [Alicyclobacillus cellulosilyticus]GGI98798.1 hypothetical protein GCM10010885_05350 [Alicyclobacillus cellulosilyticus]